MLRAIGSVIAGYVVMFITVAVSFSIAFIIMGPDGAFQEGSYAVTTTWIIASFALGLVAAVLGGLVCALIARTPKPGYALVGLVIVLGLLSAVFTLNQPDPGPRSEDTPVFEAASTAQQPPWVAFTNPFLGAAGVLIGIRLRGRKPVTPPAPAE